jgi:orotidine-5'-phosphate decarboxylase
MLTAFDEIPRKDRVIIALDCEADKAISIAYQLSGEASWVKVGMTLYYKYGADLIKILKAGGYKVFLDLKFHDIPHQVRGAARSAAEAGADMITMHTTGGLPMMQAALEGATEGAQNVGVETPVTLGITVLTSMNQETLSEVGVIRPIERQVLSLAQLANQSKISGVVASPIEAQALRTELGPDAYIVTPGVRPVGASLGDQSRVASPKKAFDNGASHIVIGRPITEAPDPIAAFRNIAAEL